MLRAIRAAHSRRSAGSPGRVMDEIEIDTSHCRIAVALSHGTGPALLMIHGNSSCKEVFRNQLKGSIGATFRCIAMDLPGHGRSGDALHPEATYSVAGYADAALELMRALGHQRFAVLGWSLGGHIGLEMIYGSDAVTGLMITGTPPIRKGPEGFADGFIPSRHMVLAGQRNFSAEEVDAYSRATCGINAPFEGFLRDAVGRTDGRARENMLSSMLAGLGRDQKEAAEHSRVPLAIVNGAEDQFINNAYIASLAYDKLWEGRVYDLDGIGHAPFWEAPDTFDPYLKRFMKGL
jgi:pimeloyl-ACP methyl ester carboxylesterase